MDTTASSTHPFPPPCWLPLLLLAALGAVFLSKRFLRYFQERTNLKGLGSNATKTGCLTRGGNGKRSKGLEDVEATQNEKLMSEGEEEEEKNERNEKEEKEKEKVLGEINEEWKSTESASADMDAKTRDLLGKVGKASSKGDLKELTQLLDVDNNNNNNDADEDSSLRVAAAQKIRESRLNLVDEKGRNAVHWAARYGQAEVVDWLIKNCHADVNLRDKDGLTPLHHAALYGNERVVKKLMELDPRPDVNRRDKRGVTPLFVAVESGHDGVAVLLLKNEADAENRPWKSGGGGGGREKRGGAATAKEEAAKEEANTLSILDLACREGLVECAKKVIMDLDYQYETQLHTSPEQLNFECTYILCFVFFFSFIFIFW